MTSSTLAMAGTSRTIGHLYDSDGNRIRITHPDGSYFTYEYDGLSRFVRMRENGGDALVTFAYDNTARRSGLTSGGTSSGYAYDAAGRLAGLTHNLVGTSGDQAIGLGYNPASQIASRSGSNDAYAWTGAAAVNRPYAVNGLNQYSFAGAATFAYDANGNLISTINPPYSTSYVYDVENRLVSASGTQSASLVYDPLGRLFETSGGAAGVTRFLYDDDALIDEYNAAGTMLHRYVHGAGKGVDDPLIWYTAAASGWRQALIADQQGSIVAVADRYGAPVAINAYDEYGVPKFGNAGRFQYTGQAWIPELGMFYYKARMYSPTLGRFLQTDPIGYDDQINLYAFVGNDPLNLRDPTGKRSCGQRCWESNGKAKSGSDVSAKPDARQFAKQHSSDVHVRDMNEAVDTNEKLSGVSRQPDGTLKLERLTSTGSSDKGEYVQGGGQLNPNTELAMHGHPDSVVPGPGDDSSISKGIPLGIEHDGRFGMLEFKDGKFRFSLDKGALRAEPGLKGRSEKKELQEVLDDYQGRLK